MRDRESLRNRRLTKKSCVLSGACQKQMLVHLANRRAWRALHELCEMVGCIWTCCEGRLLTCSCIFQLLVAVENQERRNLCSFTLDFAQACAAVEEVLGKSVSNDTALESPQSTVSRQQQAVAAFCTSLVTLMGASSASAVTQDESRDKRRR